MFVNTKNKLLFRKVEFVLSGGFLFSHLIEKVDFDLEFWLPIFTFMAKSKNRILFRKVKFTFD